MRYLFALKTSLAPSVDEQLKLASAELLKPEPIAVVTDLDDVELQGEAYRVQRCLRMVQNCKEGDEVIVVSSSVLGNSAREIIEFVRIILATDANLRILDRGLFLGQDALPIFGLVDQILDLRANGARRRPNPRGRIPEDQMDTARAAWFDANLTWQQVVDSLGVSHRTLYRKFGPRNGAVKVSAPAKAL